MAVVVLDLGDEVARLALDLGGGAPGTDARPFVELLVEGLGLLDDLLQLAQLELSLEALALLGEVE